MALNFDALSYVLENSPYRFKCEMFDVGQKFPDETNPFYSFWNEAFSLKSKDDEGKEVIGNLGSKWLVAVSPLATVLFYERQDYPDLLLTVIERDYIDLARGEGGAFNHLLKWAEEGAFTDVGAKHLYFEMTKVTIDINNVKEDAEPMPEIPTEVEPKKKK